MTDTLEASPGGVAIKTVVGAALICTGAIFLAAHLFFDAFAVAEGRPWGQPSESPYRFAVGMMFAALVLPILGIVAVIFTVRVSLARCRTRRNGLATAIVALVLMVMPFVLAVQFRYSIAVFPAVLLGLATDSAVGWYFGYLIQLGIGAWLLGWLDRFGFKQRPTI